MVITRSAEVMEYGGLYYFHLEINGRKFTYTSRNQSKALEDFSEIKNRLYRHTQLQEDLILSDFDNLYAVV